MTVNLIKYRLSFQGEDGNITHSAEGMALCEGDPDGESFKRVICARHYRDGDFKVLFSFEVMSESQGVKGNKKPRSAKR